MRRDEMERGRWLDGERWKMCSDVPRARTMGLVSEDNQAKALWDRMTMGAHRVMRCTSVGYEEKVRYDPPHTARRHDDVEDGRMGLTGWMGGTREPPS